MDIHQGANSGWNFKNIPKQLNVSGASTSAFSVNSAPLSDRTNATSVTNTPCYHQTIKTSHINNIYDSNLLSSTPAPIRRKKFQQNLINVYECAFCDESLHHVFEGEKLVDLDCGHTLHFQCFHELTTPLPLFDKFNVDANTYIKHLKNEIICPSCGKETFCLGEDLNSHIQSTHFAPSFNDLGKKENEMTAIISKLENFNSMNIVASDVVGLAESKSDLIFKGETSHPHENTCTSNENPVTPQSQIGIKFWEREDEAISPRVSEFETHLRKKNVSFFQDEIVLSEVTLAPEFPSFSFDSCNSTIKTSCVVHFSTTEFEKPLESNKEEQLKAQISKNKITNIIINNFEDNILGPSNIDFLTIGSLVVFDYFNVNIKTNVFPHTQVFLFDSCLIILDSKGTQLLLYQQLDDRTFISSIYENNGSIIINLNSIKLPSVTLSSENKILLHKWYIILGKFSEQVDVSKSIPLIQVSTNAWDLLEDAPDETYADAVPEDIKIVNKLTSKGLELPSRFLKRQILRPDSIPKVLVVAIPLVNDEDYGIEDYEFASAIKDLLVGILNSLNESDKLGIVFLGDHLKHQSMIGNYYGCTGKDWEGWQIVLESITAEIISRRDNSTVYSQCDDGIHYIEVLSKLNFVKNDKKKESPLHEIIFISNEIICGVAITPSTGIGKLSSPVQNPFLEKPVINEKIDFNRRIAKLCEEYDVNFSFILLADEFRYEPYEILAMHYYLKSLVSIKDIETNNNDYNNKIKLYIALDLEKLNDVLFSKIENMHHITVKSLETRIEFPSNVKLLGYESPLGKVTINDNDNSSNDNSNNYLIKFKNLSSGFEKSLLFNIEVNYENVKVSSNSKINIANSTSRIITDNIESMFESHMDIKLQNDKDSPLCNDVTINLNIEKSNSIDFREVNAGDNLKVSIVPQLSGVSDVYFIKRKIQSLVIDTLWVSVLQVKNFDLEARDNAKESITRLIAKIWELSSSSELLNSAMVSKKGVERWTEVLVQRLETIIDGYSLRNYQLSNSKCVALYLELE